MTTITGIKKSARPRERGAARAFGRPWWRRLSWRGWLLIAAAIFVIAYPFYCLLDESLSTGIVPHGDVLLVDLRSMSNFEMDQSDATDQSIPADYRALDGKRVALIGEMYDPYGSEDRVRSFELVYSITNCCFNGPPKVQHIVQATVVSNQDVPFKRGLVDVVGTLHVGIRKADGRIQSVYRMDVEKVSPAK